MSTPLLDRVRSRLIEGHADATPTRVASALRAEGVVLGDDAVLGLVESLRQELVGAGPLEPLLRTGEVTDVLVNGPKNVWIDRGNGLERTDVVFRSDDEVRKLAQRLASTVGRRLDDSTPFVDARLPDGTRLHAVIPPVAVEGTLISIRVPPRKAFTLDELVAVGSIDATGAQWLRSLIDQRRAFVISGGTGSGKTTILSALLGLVSADERIVMIEDSAELMPNHPHAVRLQSRVANVEGAGLITMRELVRQALRMRPDRIVVGEVRGAEVVELLTALNTGHEGGCGTVHANSAADVPARLEALGLTAGLDRLAVHALVAAGLDAVVHLQRGSNGKRVVEGIYVLTRGADQLVRAVPALRRHGSQLLPEPGIRALSDRIGACQAPARAQ
ncbi:MAG: pilus assembly protein CpaF [Actinobacteria bacterium]|nr:MAG: pilus assembly protein CpaF [Actinomycetota bacterium]